MKTSLLLLCLVALLTVGVEAQVPQIINYQGRVQSGGANFNGTGKFKFAISIGTGVNPLSQWSNDGTSSGGSEPTSAVSIPVTNGVYSVLLGDTTIANMTVAMPTAIFNFSSTLYLRVWFDDGVHGSQLLSPDQRIAPTGWSMVSSAVGFNGVTTNSIADGAVTAAKIAPVGITNPGITASQIANKTVTAAQIADGTVTATQIAPATITGAQIGSRSIGEPQLAINSVTFNQLADNSVHGSTLLDSAVQTAKIANAAVTGAKIAATTITGANIAAATITGTNIADDTITGSQIATRGIGEPELGINSVTFTQLANNSVHGVTLQDGAVTGTKIAASTITGANIAAQTITSAQLNTNSVGFDELQNGAVVTQILADKAVTGPKLGVLPAGYASSSIFSITSTGANVDIPFGTPIVDTAGLFGHYPEKNKIYFATAGIYRLDYSGNINGTANNAFWQLTGGVNGGSGGLFRDGITGTAGFVPLNGSVLVNVTAGQFYEFAVDCNGNGGGGSYGLDFSVVVTYVCSAP